VYASSTGTIAPTVISTCKPHWSKFAFFAGLMLITLPVTQYVNATIRAETVTKTGSYCEYRDSTQTGTP
jgi:hypothetical protein